MNYSLFDSLFDDVMGTMQPVVCRSSASVFTPRVDVTSDDKGYTLMMDLPGRSEEDVNIELDKNTLTISSKTVEEKSGAQDEACEKAPEEKTNWIIRERRMSEFKRTFTLPDDVALNEIKASFKNGVLTVTMPRCELPSPKKIMIEAA